MAENRPKTDSGSVRLIDPANIERNPENPRLIFREDELKSLQESIAGQGNHVHAATQCLEDILR